MSDERLKKMEAEKGYTNGHDYEDTICLVHGIPLKIFNREIKAGYLSYELFLECPKGDARILLK